jgi:hypothetical protein
MWYKKTENLRGAYVDIEGKCYLVKECSNVQHPDGRKNEELGYTQFESMEECLTAWNLTRVETKRIKQHGRREERID